MKPDQVRSPRDKLQDLNVVYTNATEGWSVAEIHWLHDDGPRPRVGMRWDGADGELGNPQSTGYPTWFLLPEGEIADMVLAHVRGLT